MSRETDRAHELAVNTVRCPACGAEPGQPCRLVGVSGTAAAGRELRRPHATRVQAARKQR